MEQTFDLNNKCVLGDSRDHRFFVRDGRWFFKVFKEEYAAEYEKETGVLRALEGCKHACRMVASGHSELSGETCLCIKMPWYGGTHLGAFLDTARAEDLSPEKVAALAVELATPFAEIEERGYRHNDIAPDNLIRTAEGFVLVDFGAAITLEDIAGGKAGPLELRGHARYNAEEKNGGRISATGDICSFGLLLKEIVARGGELGVRYPDEFLAFCDRCAADGEADRFPSFRDVLAALRAGAAPAEDTPRTPPPAPVPRPQVQTGRVRTRERAARTGGAGVRSLLACGSVTALILALTFLAMETYLTFFRTYGETPLEKHAVECRSVSGDIRLVLYDIKNRKQ